MYRRPTGSAKVNAPFKPLQISRPVEASDIPVPKVRALVPQKRGLLSVKVEENKRPVSGEGSRYNVLWRKVKNKKNKTWDGDGILSVENGYATVKNSANGKPVVSNSHFTSPIEIGDIIKMGYIEIQAEYVYTEVTQPPSDSKLIDGGKLSGHFQTPSLSKPLSKSKLGPRHDPKSAGAIVMPRPLEPIGKKVIDVVIDPLLGSKLRPHQIEGIQFLYQCIMGMKHYQGRGALLADDMGLGKTLMAITLIWTLLKQCPFDDEPFLVKRVLVVCPVTLIGNWKNEFRKWLGKDRIGIFVVDSKTANIRDFAAGRIYQVMIIGYEKIRSVANELKLANFDLVICDEGHRLKTATNKSAQAILSLNTKRRIILSGTPIQNDLSEFYTMVDFLNPEILGTYAQFKKLFEIPIMKSRQPTAMKRDIEKGNAQSEELSRITEQFILRRSVKTLENYLPPKTETVLFCLPTAKQREVYVSLLNSKEIKDCFQNDSAQDHLLAITLLKKVCNSPALVDTDLTCSFSGKLQVLETMLRQLRNTNEKVVIVSGYTQTLDLIQNMVIKQNNFPFLRLDGSTATSKRQALVNEFNNSSGSNKPFAFLLSTKSGGTGLNLIGASRLFLIDTDWNPSVDLQAMARIHRDGQTKPVYIYRLLITGAIDEKIYQRQITKQGLADSFMNQNTNKDTKQHHQQQDVSTNSFTLEELKDLFTLYTDTTSNTHDLLECPCQSRAGNMTSFSATSSFNSITSISDFSQNSLEEKVSENENDLGGWVSAKQIKEEGLPVPKRLRRSQRMKGLFDYRHLDPVELVQDCSSEEEIQEKLSVIGDEVLQTVLAKQSLVSFIFTKSNS